jgi:hypothetical protein
LIPSDPTQSPSPALSLPSSPLSPQWFSEPTESVWAPFPAPPVPRSIYIKRTPCDQGHTSQSSFTYCNRFRPCGRLLMCPSGRSFPTEDSAVFLMAGLCPLP